ncbi:hypothetical protein HMPREF9098_0872 [Kingella denitrificans ATCC 33394]|uniref:Uncharacterized protein n=1 Tax=Kingella denitrificans ATCC 33394 TaxID=888741 RepID=F0EYD8_9NEIS|nr:hypothetical protein HMPREF9098_0872 [Kingella denitrificans ATCC 33394]
MAHAATARSKAASVKAYQWLQAVSGLPKHNAVHTGSAFASVDRRQPDVSFQSGRIPDAGAIICGQAPSAVSLLRLWHNTACVPSSDGFPRFQAAVIHRQPESANLQNQACFAFVVFLKGGAGFFVWVFWRGSKLLSFLFFAFLRMVAALADWLVCACFFVLSAVFRR